MAKSKSGGTRSYIRGRVGSDVYAIGRDSKGKKQQVVRSLAESVANPQTQAQMKGRMIMSTVMQAVAALKPIIDHSFDNVIGKQPNISEFISRNYALIKADVASHPSADNVFGLNQYQEKGAKQGAYVIAAGEAQLPVALVLTKATGAIAITLPSDNITIGGLKSALGMTNEEYFTIVGITATGVANYERFRVNPNLADTTAIAAGNIEDVFGVEGNAVATIAIASNVITITLASVATCCDVIISKKTANGYIHNDAVLGSGTGFASNANTALPTYPVGSADYLNGGDIFGQSESFNGGDAPAPAPSPTLRAITSVTLNGATLAQTATLVAQSGNNTIVVNVPATDDTSAYRIGVVPSASYNVNEPISQTLTQSLSGTSGTITKSMAAGDAAQCVVLTKNDIVLQKWGTINAPAAPVTTPSSISNVTIGGASLAKAGSVQLAQGNNAAVVSVVAGTDGLTYMVACVAASAAAVGTAVAAGDQVAISDGSANLTIVGTGGGVDQAIVLVQGNQVVERWGTLTAPSAQPAGDLSLTAFTINGTNMLTPSNQMTYDSGTHSWTVAGTLDGTPDEADAYRVIESSQLTKKAGDTIDISSVAVKSQVITSQSFSFSDMNVGDGQAYFFLMKGNTVIQKLGFMDSEYEDG